MHIENIYILTDNTLDPLLTQNESYLDYLKYDLVYWSVKFRFYKARRKGKSGRLLKLAFSPVTQRALDRLSYLLGKYQQPKVGEKVFTRLQSIFLSIRLQQHRNFKARSKLYISAIVRP